MDSPVEGTNPVSLSGDGDLELLLDAVDNRTAQQQLLHGHIADGFMALARERYRDPSSLGRMGKLVYDNREGMKSKVLLRVQEAGSGSKITTFGVFEDLEDESKQSTKPKTELRRRSTGKAGNSSPASVPKKDPPSVDVSNSFFAIPSAEMREAIKHFKLAVNQAIELVNITNKVGMMIDSKE